MMNAVIVVGCDRPYYDKAKEFFKSLAKNWPRRVCVLTIDFELTQQEKAKCNKSGFFEFNHCKASDLKSYKEFWPSNKNRFVCIEGGEFFNYFRFDDDELIVHMDVDMIMQRKMVEDEIHQLEYIWENNLIGVTGSAWPLPSLREELYRLNPRRGYEKINEDFKGVLGAIPLYCSGLIVARAEVYRTLSDFYLSSIDKLIGNFDHHAAGQWLFSYILNLAFRAHDLGSSFCNALWYIDTGAKVNDEYQLIQRGKNWFEDQVVLFNHTKFNGKWLY